jgi:hypothetical protein
MALKLSEINKPLVYKMMNDIVMSPHLSLDVAKLLLTYFFTEHNLDTSYNKAVRNFLVTEFITMLTEKHTEYMIELSDYSKNAEYHDLTYKRIKNIANIFVKLQTKEYHDEIIYFMSILS